MEVRFNKSVINFKNEHGEYNLRWYGSATQAYQKRVMIVLWSILIVALLITIISFSIAFRPIKKGDVIEQSGESCIVLSVNDDSLSITKKGAAMPLSKETATQRMSDIKEMDENADFLTFEEAKVFFQHTTDYMAIWMKDESGNLIQMTKYGRRASASAYLVYKTQTSRE